MLNPDNRHLLIDAFRPPAGMTLERAVGTTFTLDLDALLLAPVALAMHSFEADGSADPLALLESVRRYADRITLFCQAGAIRVPGRVQPIVTYLEDSVIPLHMEQGRLFHPKLWVLHFAGEAAERVRLLCLSRNLTFDHSWDTILWIDGTPGDDLLIEENAPLAGFLRVLPTVGASRPVGAARDASIRVLADRVMTTEWDLPEGFDELRFWPMGRKEWSQPEFWGDRLLAISPFLSRSTVLSLAEGTKSATLISRASGIDGIGRDALAPFGEEVYVIDADLPEEGDPAPLADDDASESRPAFGLRGVHAKTFIYEQSGRAWWYTGSANATEAGIGPTVEGPARNIEFMTELSGPKYKVGIDTALDRPENGPLRNLLVQHLPENAEPVEPTEQAAAQFRLDSLVRAISAVDVATRVDPVGDDYAVAVEADLSDLSFDGAEATIRPATTGAATAEALTAGSLNRIDLGRMTISGITAFLVVEASISVEGVELRSAALIKSDVLGIDPEERQRRVFSAQFENSGDLIRYLLFLLTDLDVGQVAELLAVPTGAGNHRWATAPDSIPLLEMMLNALARGANESLERVAAVLEDLQSEDGDERRIPDGLLEAWAAIDEVRREVSR
jgi:hypothetical protein